MKTSKLFLALVSLVQLSAVSASAAWDPKNPALPLSEFLVQHRCQQDRQTKAYTCAFPDSQSIQAITETMKPNLARLHGEFEAVVAQFEAQIALVQQVLDANGHEGSQFSTAYSELIRTNRELMSEAQTTENRAVTEIPTKLQKMNESLLMWQDAIAKTPSEPARQTLANKMAEDYNDQHEALNKLLYNAYDTYVENIQSDQGRSLSYIRSLGTLSLAQFMTFNKNCQKSNPEYLELGLFDGQSDSNFSAVRDVSIIKALTLPNERTGHPLTISCHYRGAFRSIKFNEKDWEIQVNYGYRRNYSCGNDLPFPFPPSCGGYKDRVYPKKHLSEVIRENASRF